MTLPPGFFTDLLLLLTAHAGTHLPLAVAGHLPFLILDHFPDHLPADRTILSGCQIAVVTVRERNAQFAGYLKFKTIHSALCFRYCCFVR